MFLKTIKNFINLKLFLSQCQKIQIRQKETGTNSYLKFKIRISQLIAKIKISQSYDKSNFKQ